MGSSLVVAALLLAFAGVSAGQRLADLVAAAQIVGEVAGFENAIVRVRYAMLRYPPVDRRAAESRPVVLYLRVEPEPGLVNTRLLEPPRGARPSWRPGVVPRAVHIELLDSPPAPPDLGEPGTDPPPGSLTDNQWDGGRLVLATFRPFDYGVGTGRFPSVTTFLSDGVVEVWHRGLRRRMGVQAGDAFWFDAGTRITVVDDYPVGAAIVQLFPKSSRGRDVGDRR